jgi:glycogen debranching enzyme
MSAPPFVFDWRAGDDPAWLRSSEWLVTNGTGGYAFGTVLGVATRRFHGLLVANLAEPEGRFMTLARLDEELVCDGEHHALGGAERDDERLDTSAHRWLRSFRWERLMPQWELECAGRRFEKTIVMPHGHNVVCVRYRLLAGEALSLNVRPFAAFRRQDAPLVRELPPLRLVIAGGQHTLEQLDSSRVRDGAYHQGTVWPRLLGHFVEAWLRASVTATPRARCSRPYRTISATPASAASARSSTPSRPTSRAAASRRRGAWRNCCGHGC